MKFLKLAWRNTWRNRRRSLISMASIVFAVLIVTLTDSLQGGSFDMMEELAVRLFTGDLQIQRAGYEDDQKLELTLEAGEQSWDAILEQQPWITAYSRRLSHFGLISSDTSSTGALIVGVEPQKEVRVSTFIRNIKHGEALAADDSSRVLIGATMADNLGLSVGDSLVILSQGYQGVMAYGLYEVKGILETGTVEFDRSLVVMTLPAAQELFWMYDRFSEYVVKSDDFRQVGSNLSSLKDELTSSRYEVLDWEELLPDIKQTRSFKEIGSRVFFLFLMIVIGFELFNTASMSIVERTREFGVLQALGMKPLDIGVLVWLEMMIKVFLALAIGFILVFSIISMLGDTIIPLSADLQELYSEMGFDIEGFKFASRTEIFLFPLISVAIIAIVVSIYPIWRVYRLKAVEALRYE